MMAKTTGYELHDNIIQIDPPKINAELEKWHWVTYIFILEGLLKH
jgi:hypothetical protein